MAPAWTVLADVLLRRAALVARVAFDHRPDPLAGLKIDDEDLEKLLTELPGLAIADRSLIGAIEREARPAVEQARAQLRSVITKTSSQTISGNDTFSRIVRFARLSELEIEVLALACSVEIDPRRQRVVGYLNDDVSQRRLSLFTLQLLLPEHPDVGLAISPGGGLRRAALLAPAEPGVLGSVALAPSPTVFWWLAGDRTRDPELPAGSEHIAAGGDRHYSADNSARHYSVRQNPALVLTKRVETGSCSSREATNCAAVRPQSPLWGRYWPRRCPHLRRPGTQWCAKPPSNKVLS